MAFSSKFECFRIGFAVFYGAAARLEPTSVWEQRQWENGAVQYLRETIDGEMRKMPGEVLQQGKDSDAFQLAVCLSHTYRAFFKECQSADWKEGGHRQECKVIARLRIWNRTDWG